MHKFFANWYRLVMPEPTSDALEKRWAGIEAYCEEIKKDNAFELVRMFFGRPTLQESSEEKFRQTFKDADSAFLMKDNRMEVQVLAGSAIVNILDSTPSDLTDASALAVLCAHCRGLRSEVLITDVITYSRDYVSEESLRVREVDDIGTIVIPTPITREELNALSTSVKEGSLESNPEVLVKLMERLAEATIALSGVNETVSRLNRGLAIQQEETNILWWLFAEQSRDREAYVGDIDLPGLCLIVGKELADLTMLQPGARPAPAFVDRMLRTGRVDVPASSTIAAAVNSSSREWRRAWMNASDTTILGDICPVHFATSKSLETEDEAAWVPLLESRTGVDASHAIGLLHLSMQTYQEALLIRLAK